MSKRFLFCLLKLSMGFMSKTTSMVGRQLIGLPISARYTDTWRSAAISIRPEVNFVCFNTVNVVRVFCRKPRWREFVAQNEIPKLHKSMSLCEQTFTSNVAIWYVVKIDPAFYAALHMKSCFTRVIFYGDQGFIDMLIYSQQTSDVNVFWHRTCTTWLCLQIYIYIYI